MRTILGPSVTSVLSFNGIVCGGYFDLGIVIALVVLTITLATLPASEIETGFADLILARPMRRHWLITRTIALVLFAILLMLFMIMVGTWAGLATVRSPGRLRAARAPDRLAGPGSGDAAAVLGRRCHGLRRRLPPRRRAPGHVPDRLRGLAPGLCAKAVAARSSAIGWLSPFRYFTPFELVMGDPLPVENLLVLGAIALTGFTVAYFIISHRDISR